MTFTPAFLDEIRSRLALSDLIGRKVKLVRKGREHSGLCPFHTEKTPSFTVNDDKGFYHCFGCGAHGDHFKFVGETEGLSFPEAVADLAGQAGLELPKPDPEAVVQSNKRAGLIEVCAMAATFFENALRGNMGRTARDYIEGRGLTPETIKRFALGFAPQERRALTDALRGQGVDTKRLVEAGLSIQPEDGGPAFDRFRNRLMFPIRDRRGRVIAFGGRALDDAPAKYLNSPETPLFHKGHTVYNWDKAGQAAHKSSRLYIAEGYMDVIALAQAGAEEAIAPLGTAVTEDQLGIAWRMVAEPTLCFDGDKAGRRAAIRAAERALPLLKPGRSLQFALMPEGEDPDSLVRSAGLEGFERICESAMALSDLLWRNLLETHRIDTPERQAGLKSSIFNLIGEIAHEDVRGLYRRLYLDRFQKLVAPQRSRRESSDRRGLSGRRSGYRESSRGRGAPMFKGGKSLLETSLMRGKNQSHSGEDGSANPENAAAARSGLEALILTIGLNHPAVLAARFEEIADLPFHEGALDKLRGSLLSLITVHQDLDSETLRNKLEQLGRGPELARLSALSWNPVSYAEEGCDHESVARGLHHVIERLRRLSVLAAEVTGAERSLREEWSEVAERRLFALIDELNSLAGREAEL
ncbi:MAG: DNA primase [Pseudomonadota bacterium]